MSIFDFAWAKKFTFNNRASQPYFEDFPVLLYIQGNNILDANYVDWSHFQEAGGADFRVYAKNGVTLLDYEIDRWDGASKEAWVWARVPLAIRDGNDFLWVAYGQAGAEDAQHQVEVWNNKYRMVFHMEGANCGEIVDSTFNNLYSDGEWGSPLYKQVALTGRGIQFSPGSGDHIRVRDYSRSLDVLGSGAWHVLFVAKADNVNQSGRVVDKISSHDWLWMWSVGFAADSMLAAPGKKFVAIIREVANERGCASSLDYADGNWHVFAVSWDKSLDSMTMFVDGIEVAKNDDHIAGDWPQPSIDPWPPFIGGYDFVDFFSGTIDEIRISGHDINSPHYSDAVRSNDWNFAESEAILDLFGTWGAEQIPGWPYEVSQSQLELLRTVPQKSKAYLGIARGETLYQVQVEDVDPADGDLPSGSLKIWYVPTLDSEQVRNTDEIWVGTEVGLRDIGVVAPVGGSVTFGPGNHTITCWPTSCPIKQRHYLTIRRVNRLWTFPWILDECTTPLLIPVACMGPIRLGFVNESLSFDASPSWARGGKIISTYRWDFADASPHDYLRITTHTWTEPGEYWVELYLEDSSGESCTAYRPVLIYNRPGEPKPIGQLADLLFPYTSFELTEIGSGKNSTLRIMEECSLEDFRGWMQVVIVTEDWYGDTKVEWGS